MNYKYQSDNTYYIVEAIQYNGNNKTGISYWSNGKVNPIKNTNQLLINQSRGCETALVGDYILRTKGRKYFSLTPELFSKFCTQINQ